jgi:membrane-bound serine protease (ClpP class)
MVTRSMWWRRWWIALLICGAAFAVAQAQNGAQTGAQSTRPAPAHLALLSAIKGPIGPATAKQVKDALAEAHERRASAVILELDTPGGLSSSTREIITAILSSDVPVIGYVAPPGAHAASAGTYILYATSLAAMAPGTNLGAATPIQIGGVPGLPDSGKGDEKKSSGSTLEHKIVNDAVAQIRALAEMHGRNADWAEKAVREAATLTASQAKAQKVVELIAPDIPTLLGLADGRSVVTAIGTQTLHTAGLTVERVEPGFVARVLAVISNPNIAFILMLIGIYGLVFEFSNPGTIGPGVLGAICLVLGLYALNQLPLDYAGLALLLLGIGLMVAEAITPTLGVLGVGGLAAFIVGAAMLVDSDQPEFRLSWMVIGGTALLTGALLILVLGYVWRSQRTPAVTGHAEVEGVNARVLEWKNGQGTVWVRSERWRARGPETLEPGDIVRVSKIDGLTLVVAPAATHADA